MGLLSEIRAKTEARAQRLCRCRLSGEGLEYRGNRVCIATQRCVMGGILDVVRYVPRRTVVTPAGG